jgi:hypothetical protein
MRRSWTSFCFFGVVAAMICVGGLSWRVKPSSSPLDLVHFKLDLPAKLNAQQKFAISVVVRNERPLPIEIFGHSLC